MEAEVFVYNCGLDCFAMAVRGLLYVIPRGDGGRGEVLEKLVLLVVIGIHFGGWGKQLVDKKSDKRGSLDLIVNEVQD